MVKQEKVATAKATPTSKPVLDNSELLDSIEEVNILLPRQPKSGKEADILMQIIDCGKVVKDCLAKFKAFQSTTDRMNNFSELTAAKRQRSIKKLSKIVRDTTRKLSMMPDMGAILQALKNLDADMKERVKVMETQIELMSASVKPAGSKGKLGETPASPAPPQGSAPVYLDGEKACAPAPPPPVEIKKTGSQQDKLEAKVEPPKISSSATAKELGAPGTGNVMDKKALLELMERHLEPQQRERRDQDKSEFEYVGVPAPATPAPTLRNVLAQDLALTDSDTNDDTDYDDDEEEDEDDFGSSSEESYERKRKLALDVDPAPKKMKVAPASMNLNPFESIKKIKETEPERANAEAANGKGDHGARRVPIQSNPTSTSNIGSFRAASGPGFGTFGRGTFPGGRSFSSGKKDAKEKPKQHDSCSNCGKPFTNKDRLFSHQKDCKPPSYIEIILD